MNTNALPVEVQQAIDNAIAKLPPQYQHYAALAVLILMVVARWYFAWKGVPPLPSWLAKFLAPFIGSVGTSAAELARLQEAVALHKQQIAVLGGFEPGSPLVFTSPPVQISSTAPPSGSAFPGGPK
jgi:hypothetical protein